MTCSSYIWRLALLSGMTMMVLGVTAFQNVLVIKATMPSACSTVALESSTGTRRVWKSGSKITLMPASFPMVS